MKKITILIIVAALIALTGLSYAAEEKKVMEPAKAQVQPPAMQRPEMQRPMGKMPMGMMMPPMHPMRAAVRQMVASNDGGVIVTTGEKLIKYDKDLKMVKEVTIPQEPQAMEGMPMQPPMQMQGKCPMCGQMMQPGGMEKGPAVEQPKEQKK